MTIFYGEMAMTVLMLNPIFLKVLELILHFLNNGVLCLRWDKIWLKRGTLQINFFIWLLARDNILIVENLKKCGFHFSGRCIMFLCQIEDSSHLFLSWTYATSVWEYVLYSGRLSLMSNRP